VNDRTHHILLSIHLPEAPFSLVLNNFLNVAYISFSSPLFLSWTSTAILRNVHGPPAFGMYIYLVPRDMSSLLAQFDVTPPSHELFGILEAARTDV
jgi:hypothetical protein